MLSILKNSLKIRGGGSTPTPPKFIQILKTNTHTHFDAPDDRELKAVPYVHGVQYYPYHGNLSTVFKSYLIICDLSNCMLIASVYIYCVPLL